MSFTPRIAAPAGRFFSTTSDQLVRLSTREDALRYRINNQITSLVSSVETLQATRQLRAKILFLQGQQTNLQAKREGLARAISHKAFLYPEEVPVQEQQELAKIQAQLGQINKQLTSLSARKC